MTFEQWVSAASTIGIPAVILAALGYCAWKFGWWFAIEVIKPVSTRHIAFLDTLETVVGKIAISSDKICDQMITHSDRLKVSGDQCDDHHKVVIEKLDDHGRKLTDILKK